MGNFYRRIVIQYEIFRYRLQKKIGFLMSKYNRFSNIRPRYLAVSAALFSTLVLSSCDDRVSLAEICEQSTEICTEFKQDSWCKKERVSIARLRMDIKNNNLETDKFKALVAYEGYIKCMSLAAQIQHIKLKEKGTFRKQNVIKAKESLNALVDQTRNSDHPHLLYYHWSREIDANALGRLLKLEGTSQLENSTAQYHLATYYIKRNTTKTLKLLYRALELHELGTVLESEVLQTLSSIHIKKKLYKKAYIWLKVYQLYLDEPDKLTEESLSNYAITHKLDTDFLDKVASNTLDKILDGEFVSPKL